MNISEKYQGGISQERILHKESIFPELLCGLCHQVLFRPQVCSECEIPFCEPCLDEWKRHYYNDTKTCPNGCVGQYIRPSKTLKNFLNRLKINCQYVKNGCDRDLTYEDLEQHESECDYQEVICAGCINKVLRKDIKGHQAECDMILTTCTKCGKELTKTELKDSHGISACFDYKFEKLEETFEKKIVLLEDVFESKIKVLQEENKNSQRKIENDLLEKIRVLEEHNKRLEMKIEELLQDKEKCLEEEEKNAALQKESKLSKKSDLKEYKVFEICSNPQIINMSIKTTCQKLTMDSTLDLEDQQKIWHIENSAWNKIRCYDNIEAVKEGKFKEITLPVSGYGTYWTIFRGSLYFGTGGASETQTIVKLNLSTNIVERNEKLLEATGGNTTNSWSGYNDVLFISNTQNLYTVYESKITNKIVINLMDPETLKEIKSWRTNSQPKRTYGSIFMINDVMFATKCYSNSPTKIIYKYDTKTFKEENIDINFANVGGYDSSLHFCYPANQLWTVNNGKFYNYDVKDVKELG